MLTIPLFLVGLALLSGTMAMLLMWLQKRPQPQTVLVPVRINNTQYG
jgi:hypothetical protein